MTDPAEAEVAELAKLIDPGRNSWDQEAVVRSARRILAAGYRLPGPVSDADMRAFGASHIACQRWPDDTPEHRACRAAYIAGAADCPLGPVTDAEVYEVVKELQMTEWLPLDPKYPAVLKDAVRTALEAARKVR